jgi:DNA-directed RNA polymerase specialized sigma subunit
LNPLDDALTAKVKLGQQRKADDHALWQQWKASPTPDNMHPLVQRFEPVFQQKMTEFKAPNVNPAAFKARAKTLAIEAFHTYDPDRGASLNTWMHHKLEKLKRFNTQHQNMAYLPEAKAGHIGRIQSAQEELLDDLGRPATSHEIANYLNPNLSKRQQLKPHVIDQILLAAGQKDVIGSDFESDPTPRATTREREVIGLLRPALNTDQQQVFDHLYGMNNKPKITSTNALAKALGKSPSQVSRLRTAILNKYNEYL